MAVIEAAIDGVGAYPAEVVLESDIFAIPSLQNAARILSDAETSFRTRLEVRTHSGDRIGPLEVIFV